MQTVETDQASGNLRAVADLLAVAETEHAYAQRHADLAAKATKARAIACAHLVAHGFGVGRIGRALDVYPSNVAYWISTVDADTDAEAI